MKKLFVLCVVLCITAGTVSAQSQLSAGYSFGFQLEMADVDTTVLSHGVTVKYEGYGRGSDTGFFMSAGYYFPFELTTKQGLTQMTVKGSVYDSISFLTGVLGVTFRQDLGGIGLYANTGVSLSRFAASLYGFSLSSISVGICADIGLKINTGSLFLTVGSNVGYDLYAFTETNGAKNSGRYNMFSLRPYAGLGFTF